ncbi:hypothetical protein Hanom_Chr10g00893081 [Helianthus anomalus]
MMPRKVNSLTLICFHRSSANGSHPLTKMLHKSKSFHQHGVDQIRVILVLATRLMSSSGGYVKMGKIFLPGHVRLTRQYQLFSFSFSFFRYFINYGYRNYTVKIMIHVF